MSDLKLEAVLKGQAVIAGDEWLNSVELPVNVVSIPNPDRVGTKDLYIVGAITNPTIAEYRKSLGLT